MIEKISNKTNNNKNKPIRDKKRKRNTQKYSKKITKASKIIKTIKNMILKRVKMKRKMKDQPQEREYFLTIYHCKRFKSPLNKDKINISKDVSSLDKGQNTAEKSYRKKLKEYF